MANYSQKSVNKSKNQNGKKPLDKKIIAVIAAVVLAIVVVVGTIAGVTLSAKKDVEPSTEKTTISATESTEVESTQAETNTDADTTAQSTEATEKAPETENAKYPQKLNKIMYVTASTLNVRSGPSTDSKVIARYAEGNEAKVIGRYDKDWYIVDINGTKGYCSAGYLSDKKGVSEVKNPAPYMLYVNRKQNIVTVYKKDANGDYTVPYKAMICSVGNHQGATPTGTFHTTDKYTWRLLVGGVYGQYATRVYDGILFHSVPYNSQNKGDLNAAEYNKLGVPASHGCIRLTVADAKWIYDNCPPGTPVKVYDSDAKEPIARPTAQKIDLSSPNKGWDPTDPDPKNPWNR